MLALLQQGRLHVNALVDLVNRDQPDDSHHSQPAISHHLTLMRGVGLVDFDRRGKNNFYFLAASNLRELLEGFFCAAGTSSLDLASSASPSRPSKGALSRPRGPIPLPRLAVLARFPYP